MLAVSLLTLKLSWMHDDFGKAALSFLYQLVRTPEQAHVLFNAV